MKYLTLTGLSRFFSNLRKMIPSKTSELQNDSGFITSQQVPDITGYSKSEVDDLLAQKATDSATVHKQGNETISGLKQFTSGLYLKHPTHSGNDAPQSNITLDGIDFTSTDKIWGQLTYKWNTDGSTSLLLSVQNYNSSNAGQTDIDFALSKDLSSCYLAPSDNNFVSLGLSNRAWKSVYAQSYYYNGVAWGLDKANVWTGENTFSGTLKQVNSTVTKGTIPQSDTTAFGVYWGGTGVSSLNNGLYVQRLNLGADGSTTVLFYALENASGGTYTSLSLKYDPNDTVNKRSAHLRGDLRPYYNNEFNLGTSTNQWKSVYANSYYLGSTQFGDIVTHNASEFLTSHQSLSNYVTLDGAQTISGEKTFTTFPIVKATHATNGIIKIKSPTTFGTAPSTTYTYALRCIDKEDTILADFIAQQLTSGTNLIQLRVRNTDGTLVYDRRVSLRVETDGTTVFVPYADDVFYLGYSNLKWKAVYSNAYYLGTTAFGDIVTHNASEYAASSHTHTKSQITDFPTLATVATSGSYNDLSDKPTIPTVNNATLTIQKNGTTVKTFTANASSNVTANITVPTKTSDLTNDSHQSITIDTDTTSTASPAHSGTFTCIDSVTRDSNGHVTAINTKTVTLPSDNNTDTKVTQAYSTTNNSYPVLSSATAGITSTDSRGAKTAIVNNGIYTNPSTGALYATKLYSNGTEVLTAHQSLSNYSTKANTVKSLSISGKTITVTPGSGDTYTLTTQDTVYTHPTTAGNKHIPSGGSSGQFLGWDSDGTAKWVNNPNTNTDTLMTQNVSTTNATYPVLLVATADATANQGAKTGIFAKSVKVNPSTNVISASGFSGPLTGNVTGDVTGNCSGSSGSCTGNAATATQFSANKAVTLTGDVTGTASSKAGWSVATTLANSGVTAGSYGPTADVTGNNNATISVPQITVDAKGRVTSVVNRTLTCKNNTYTVNNATLTIQKNGTSVKTFTANASSDVTCNITVPTKTSELTNDSGFLTAHQSLNSCVKTSGDQDIDGSKRFTNTNITIKNTGFTVGTAPSANRFWSCHFADSANAGCARILKYVNKDGSSGIEIQDYKYNATSTTVTLKAGFDSSGNAYSSSSTTFSAPCLSATTNNSSNGIKIGSYTIYVG